MYLDIHFWEGICLFILIGLCYIPAKRALVEYLNEYSDLIKQKIDDAEQLHKEAEKTFKYYKNQHKIFSENIKIASKNTEENIKLMRKKATEVLGEKIKARMLIHKEKLNACDKEELDQVKSTVIKKALTLANLYIEDVIKPNLTRAEINQLLDVAKTKTTTFH